jgi:hypothetical protein
MAREKMLSCLFQPFLSSNFMIVFCCSCKILLYANVSHILEISLHILSKFTYSKMLVTHTLTWFTSIYFQTRPNLCYHAAQLYQTSYISPKPIPGQTQPVDSPSATEVIDCRVLDWPAGNPSSDERCVSLFCWQMMPNTAVGVTIPPQNFGLWASASYDTLSLDCSAPAHKPGAQKTARQMGSQSLSLSLGIYFSNGCSDSNRHLMSSMLGWDGTSHASQVGLSSSFAQCSWVQSQDCSTVQGQLSWQGP